MSGRWRTLGTADEFEDPRQVPWPLGAPQDDDTPQGAAKANGPVQGVMWPRPPDTDLQALMEAAPGESPAKSATADLAVGEVLAEAIEAMPERLRWVFQAHHNRGLSFRQIADEIGLGKTWVHVLYGDAKEWLAARLSDEPLIAERLVEPGGDT